VDVKNEKNGKVVRVAVNDRGPFVAGRIVDLSKAAAAEIDSVVDGVVPVTLTVVTVGDNSRRKAAPSPDAQPVTAWAVQAGAFSSDENARRLMGRLAERYPKPWTEDAAGLKRVKFGPYRSKSDAESARDSLADLGLAGIVVAFSPAR
jgi:rare lipoprotein A